MLFDWIIYITLRLEDPGRMERKNGKTKVMYHFYFLKIKYISLRLK